MALMYRPEFRKYVKTLRTHDWYYQYSDDGSVFRAGAAIERSINELRNKYAAAQDAYDLYFMYKNSTGTPEDLQVLQEEFDKIEETLPGEIED